MKLEGALKVENFKDYDSEIVEENLTQEECIINQALICPQGKSLNGRCKKFNLSYDKLILISNLKGVSFWGCNLH